MVDRRKQNSQYLTQMTSERISEARLHVSGHISGVYRPIWIKVRGNVPGGSPLGGGHVSEPPKMGFGVKITDCEHTECCTGSQCSRSRIS